MAKTRSPNYPVISLPEAIKKARQVWEKERHGKMSREVAVKHMGYNSLNGASMGVVSALGKYGLLEGRGDSLKLSPIAMSILHDAVDSPERKSAIWKAALSPTLFGEFHSEFGDHLPSEENLNSYLLKRGFIPNAASAANRAYRETMALVEQEAGEYNEASAVHNGDGQGGPMHEPAPSQSLPGAPSRGSAAPRGQHLAAPLPPGEGVLWLQVPYKGTALTVRIEAGGQRLTREHVARVRGYLKMAEDDLEASGMESAYSKDEGED